MEESLQEAIFLAFSAICFALAVTLLLLYQRQLNQANEKFFQLSGEQYVITDRNAYE